jgi:hypothetical protein
MYLMTGDWILSTIRTLFDLSSHELVEGIPNNWLFFRLHQLDQCNLILIAQSIKATIAQGTGSVEDELDYGEPIGSKSIGMRVLDVVIEC